eukprot:gene32257-39012_t
MESIHKHWNDSSAEPLMYSKVAEEAADPFCLKVMEMFQFLEQKNCNRRACFFIVSSQKECFKRPWFCMDFYSMFSFYGIPPVNSNQGELNNLEYLVLQQIMAAADDPIGHRPTWDKAVTIPNCEFNKEPCAWGTMFEARDKPDGVKALALRKQFSPGVIASCIQDGKIGFCYVKDSSPDEVQGFIFITVKFVNQEDKTCSVHVDWLLSGQKDLGANLVSYALSHVESLHPGFSIHMTTESKTTAGAKNFWFNKMNFEKDALDFDIGDDIPPKFLEQIAQPGYRDYTPHFVLDPEETEKVRQERDEKV